MITLRIAINFILKYMFSDDALYHIITLSISFWYVSFLRWMLWMYQNIKLTCVWIVISKCRSWNNVRLTDLFTVSVQLKWYLDLTNKFSDIMTGVQVILLLCFYFSLKVSYEVKNKSKYNHVLMVFFIVKVEIRKCGVSSCSWPKRDTLYSTSAK